MSDGPETISPCESKEEKETNPRDKETFIRNKNSQKRARTFNLEEIVLQTRKAAQARSLEVEEKQKTEKEAANTYQDFAKSLSLQRKDNKASSGAEHSSSGVSGDDDDDDDFIPMLPPGFKADETVIVQDEKDAERMRKEALNGGEEEEDDEFIDYSGEGVPTVKIIPTACEATLSHGPKPVTALAFDQQGLRFVTGGQDYAVNIFDFAKMDSSLRPDRHIINSLAFNANGEILAVAAAHAQLRLLDRKGSQWAETVRGDQYLVDMSYTKGHVAAINAIQWNPLIKTEFITAADDGTLRIWTTDDFKVITKCINTHSKLIKTKNRNGKRAQPGTVCYSPDGKFIAAGCDDGSIQMWKYGKMFVNTAFLARDAHTRPVTSIAFSADSTRILSRSLDDTLKMWSVKDPKKPLLEKRELENDWINADCGFSPRGELVYTGTSHRGDNPGKLIFLHPDTFEPIYNILYPEVSVIRIAWHARLNQILVGLSDGLVKVYYDPLMSQGGILNCIKRPKRRQTQNEVLREELTLSPLSLDMFQPRGDNPDEQEVTGWRLRKYLRMRDKQQRPQFRKPAEMPQDKSVGGRTHSGSTLHSYVAQQIGKERNKDFLADTDVRGSILRHAEEAAKNPEFVAKAYMKNQPVPIFSKEEEDDDEEDELEPVYKMPRSNFSRN